MYVWSFISMNCVFTAFEQSDSAPKHQKGLTIIIIDDDNTPIGQKPIAADSDIEMDVINSSEDELQSANLVQQLIDATASHLNKSSIS
jgi:hypothetical protein